VLTSKRSRGAFRAANAFDIYRSRTWSLDSTCWLGRTSDAPVENLVVGCTLAYPSGRELIKGGWSRCSSGNGPFAGDQISAQNELVRSRPS
jgi:hypothetical protein